MVGGGRGEEQPSTVLAPGHWETEGGQLEWGDGWDMKVREEGFLPHRNDGRVEPVDLEGGVRGCCNGRVGSSDQVLHNIECLDF